MEFPLRSTPCGFGLEGENCLFAMPGARHLFITLRWFSLSPGVNYLGVFPVIRDYLLPGKANAVRSKVLAEACGFHSVRELQAAIEKERRAGAVILSTTSDGGGYYLPASEAEVKVFIRTLQRRAKNTLLSVRSAEEYLRRADGQEQIAGW